MQKLKRAEAEAESLKLIIAQYKQGDSKAVMRMRLNQDYIDTIKLLGNKNNNVILKNDLSNIEFNTDICKIILDKKK